LLEGAGWKLDPTTKLRSKDGVPLKFRLFSAANSEFTSVSGSLQKQWREIGADVEVVLQPDEELQSTVSGHNYDALLYGISVGPDPDVYAYWHSTQADVRSETRLNLSEYKSPAADKALEAGRTRSDPQIRTVKYRPFLEAWKSDAPALAMYQPRYLYIATDALRGFEVSVAHTAVDRYAHVENWTVRKEPKNN
jgi:peptide/nickel transport system substrate-binding protein